MLTHRRERANVFIQEELSLLLHDAMSDPRFQSLIITGVDLTRDRRVARVYVASYDGEGDLKVGLEALESAKGYVRAHLAPLLAWRFTPEIEFRADRSWQQGAKVDQILRQLRELQPPSETSEADTGGSDSGAE